MEAEAIAAIADLVVRHGVPAALRIIRAWPVKEPTVEDIRALREMVPPPESYFEDHQDTAG